MSPRPGGMMQKKRAGPALVLLLASVLAVAGQQAAQLNHEQEEDKKGFQAFGNRVQEYIKLHKAVEAGLPALKTKEELPEVIVAHRQALARKIREARPHARRGDIFAEDCREAFRHAVRDAFQGPQAASALATVREQPIKQVHLRVNQVYPDSLPRTTVPPSLLQTLPQLPDEVAYRIVGHDLVLLDVKAAMVVDVMRGIIP